MKRISILLLLVISCAAFAEVYVNQTNSGTEYTDTPSTHSREVTVPPVNSISSTHNASSASPTAPTSAYIPGNEATNKSVSPDAKGSVTPVTYKTFEIISPKPEENIQNQAVVSVEFKVEPNMASGDKIQIILDNKPAGTPTGMVYQELPNVERGTHTIYAVILNSQNTILKQTGSVTFYVHRNSVITSPATGSRSSNSNQTSLQIPFESTQTAS